MRSHYSYCSSLVANADNSASTTKKSKNSAQLSASEIAFRGTCVNGARCASNNHNCSTTEQTNSDYFSYNHHNNTGIEAEKTFHHTQFHHLPPTLIMQQPEQPRNNTCINKKIINNKNRRNNNKTSKLGLFFKFYLNNRSMQIFLPLIIFCVASINAFDINQQQQQQQQQLLQHTSSSYIVLSNGSLKNNISSNNIIYKIPLSNNDQLNVNRDVDVSANHHKNKNSIRKTRIYEDSANVSQKDSIEDYEDETESDVNLNNRETTITKKHQADRNSSNPYYSYDHIIPTNFSNSCPSCGSHEDLKRVSLEFIKYQVLHKLGLERPPNITNFPKVNDLIIQNLLNNNGSKRYMSMKSATTTTNNYEMIGDDPTPYRDDFYTRDRNEEEEEDINYYSITQRVIALPISKYTF
jgi:hypothetical protein